MSYPELTHIAVDDIITRSDVADMLGCTPQAVSNMVNRGTDGIPAPVHTSRQGMIFSRRQIADWAVRTGRLEDGATL